MLRSVEVLVSVSVAVEKSVVCSVIKDVTTVVEVVLMVDRECVVPGMLVTRITVEVLVVVGTAPPMRVVVVRVVGRVTVTVEVRGGRLSAVLVR